MSVNGGYTSTGAATAYTVANPNGGQPNYPPPAGSPTVKADYIVTTNALGAFANNIRPIS